MSKNLEAHTLEMEKKQMDNYSVGKVDTHSSSSDQYMITLGRWRILGGNDRWEGMWKLKREGR